VSLDRANRSFLAAVGAALLFAVYVLCGALGVVLVPLLQARAAARGLGGLLDDLSLLLLLALVGALAASLLRANRSLARQMLASRRLAREMNVLTCRSPERLTRAAALCGLDARVVLLDAPEVFSFVYGALTPRVAVSHGLLERVSGSELRAVLEHERYHVRNLDPLKVMLMRALASALPFLPVLDSLRAHYLASRELAADRHALAACGRRPLAGALLKVARGPRWSEHDLTASFADSELLNLRLLQLETGAEPTLQSLRLIRAAASLLGAAMLPAALLVSASRFGDAAATPRAGGIALVATTLIASLSCAAPFAAAALLAYLAIALRAARGLGSAPPSTR
jgi:Zn-dependent protease with chaperone function